MIEASARTNLQKIYSLLRTAAYAEAEAELAQAHEAAIKIIATKMSFIRFSWFILIPPPVPVTQGRASSRATSTPSRGR